MTREEAITILKAFMENPLFSNVHKAAFNIAIHDIKQRHNWDINNLILVNKDNYEPIEQEPILDKIRAEIQKLRGCSCSCSDGIIDDVEDILDKYKAESEAEDGNDDR